MYFRINVFLVIFCTFCILYFRTDIFLVIFLCNFRIFYILYFCIFVFSFYINLYFLVLFFYFFVFLYFCNFLFFVLFVLFVFFVLFLHNVKFPHFTGARFTVPFLNLKNTKHILSLENINSKVKVFKNSHVFPLLILTIYNTLESKM